MATNAEPKPERLWVNAARVTAKMTMICSVMGNFFMRNSGTQGKTVSSWHKRSLGVVDILEPTVGGGDGGAVVVVENVGFWRGRVGVWGEEHGVLRRNYDCYPFLFRRSLTRAQIISAASLVSSCSHTRITFQPASSSRRVVSASRSRFCWILVCQNSEFAFA